MGCGASAAEIVGACIGVKKGRSVRRLTVIMRILVQQIRVRTVMLFDKVSVVGVKEAVGDPARRMTSSSVRKKQQPPSLERLGVMLRRRKGLVNDLSIGLERQVVGQGAARPSFSLAECVR